MFRRSLYTSLQGSAPSFNGDSSRASIAQMDMMERSAVLSKCGQYLVLSATIGSEKYQMLIDLPNIEASNHGRKIKDLLVQPIQELSSPK
jgi:hypothetical protein